jgi:RNA polymerase sigma-70 factor (ECF subfamily)
VLSVAEHATASSAVPAQFDDLFRLEYPRLVPLAERLLADRADAEDVVQEAFLRLARASRQTGSAADELGQTGLLHQPSAVIGAWLRRVVLNLGVNRLRDQRRAAERIARAGRLDADLDPERAADASSPATALVRSEIQAEVQAALATLPDRQSACLLLRHAGHSYAEIAETLGIAIGSVGVYLARAERAFRAAYTADDPDEGPASPRGVTPCQP